MGIDLDRVIHEPARLRIMMILSGLEEADFKFLRSTLEMTKGNLSSHMDRLERAGYVKIIKSFQGRMPHTAYRLTHNGKSALERYWVGVEEIRWLGQMNSSEDANALEAKKGIG